MLTYINVLGRTIPVYGLIGIAGILSGGLIVYLRSGRASAGEDMLFMYIYGVIGAFAGAKLFSLIQNMPDIIADIGLLFSDPSLFAGRYISAGLVFYGGLAGAFAGAFIYARRYKVPFSPCLAAVLPVMPFVHAVGRAGCFMAGCCYGKPTESIWGIRGADGIMRLPVQLYESAVNLVIFAVLLNAPDKLRSDGAALAGLYFVMYAAARFVLEFMRGDTARGFIGPLSTAQVLSIILIAAGIALSAGRRKSSSGT
ncbi:MAG: prolipoprotein diacylglyceryl transferase [Eubacteriales bacterium]|jgi:phosphatidylglycerol:prolipoprotein diacylglycerol transferase|nr:prolipoprotein diacylglyceryl transferase [Eubacteriales bacterium]